MKMRLRESTRPPIGSRATATKESTNMSKAKISTCLFAFLLATATSLSAQEPNPTQQSNQSNVQASAMTPAGSVDNVPLYKIEVVARDIPAINYFHRSGSTHIGFQGTSLLPGAKGEAKVESKLGRTVIDADIRGLSPANGFGPEYLTYVMWAITPEGRPVNLGEVLPSGGREGDHFTVTSNLQAFGLIVTAEPYFAVTMPSDLVVMQNTILEDKTEGVIEPVVAHYSLLPRGAYAETAGRHTVLNPITRNERAPLELYEAQNAVQIAVAAGADKYAADTIATAKTALHNADDLDLHKDNRKQCITYAREAVQAAEDARIITIRKIKAEDDAATQQARVNAEQNAQQAQEAAQQSQQAAEKAQQDALKAQEEARLQAEQRAKANAEAAEAEARAKQAREAQQAAEQAQQAAEQSAQQAAQQVQQARERLKTQLNQVLQTTESARGLIVNMSDVLFDFNKYTLKPEAREKLAKVSGILLSYPDLKLQVEGYTDNIGSDEYNQKLSEERAGSVRQYLVTQSVSDNNVTAAGFGKTRPVADNSTNSGRAQNRRVELVVSGASIGIDPGAPGANSQTQPAPDTQQAQPGQSAASSQPAPSSDRSGTSNPQQ
jgi:outer membrane protein OmpA-like peptidoglycan-associated protein